MNFPQFLKKIFIYTAPSETDEFILRESANQNIHNCAADTPDKKVSYSIDENLAEIKRRFTVPDNSDVVIREVKVGVGDGARRAFAVFIDGMANGATVNSAVIQPLIQLSHFDTNSRIITPDDIAEKFIWHGQIKKTDLIQPVIDEVNFGGCGVFVDRMEYAFALDIKGWNSRGIGKPENEQSVYGPQEAFAEVLRSNTALVRKILKDERLICEMQNIGKISKTPAVLMYIKGITNESLVSEIRRRIKGVEIDYMLSVEELSLMIEDKTFMLTNQILATERPDRVARALAEGRAAVIMNGSPKALILPTNSFELTHVASDAYMRLPYANMARIVRYIAMLLSILFPALYLAVTLFHQEMIPTYLLYSISAARENVPFPSIIEIILMEMIFEVIREASIRAPGPIGSTLGIVGGIILGDAAVSARLVSPMMIIVVAVTGIGSFAAADYSLGWSYRILRLIFMILAVTGGFFAIAAGIYVYCCVLSVQKSFGVPFLAPLAEGKNSGFRGSVLVKPIWKNEERPDFLRPQSRRQEPKISRKWRK